MSLGSSRRLGKGPLLESDAWAETCSRRAHAELLRQTILPTLHLQFT